MVNHIFARGEKKVLVSITTITPNLWKKKVKEIDRLGLKEVALFPTCLDKKQRKNLYNSLEKTNIKKIPFVHLRDDMMGKEIEYLAKRFNTKVFNIHPSKKSLQFLTKNKQWRKKIYIENLKEMGASYEKGLKISAGICLDISHWEDYGRMQKGIDYKGFAKKIKNTKIGCCHISGIRKTPFYFKSPETGKRILNYNDHTLKELKDLQYAKKYKKYLQGYIALELENSLVEQLEAKKYIEKIIK